MTKNQSHRPVCPKKWLTITPLNNDKVKSKQLQLQNSRWLVSLGLGWCTIKNVLLRTLECRGHSVSISLRVRLSGWMGKSWLSPPWYFLVGKKLQHPSFAPMFQQRWNSKTQKFPCLFPLKVASINERQIGTCTDLVGTAFGKIQKNDASHKDKDKKSASQCP